MTKIYVFVNLFFLPFFAAAQTCSGSLGDPVLLETFGAGYVGNPHFKSTYTYFGGCPPKYSYTLSSFLFGCGDTPHGSWVKLTGDHTGDPGGNYMLVNAESLAGTVYADTAKGLCGNTVYEFGVWVTSVMTSFSCGGHAILPKLIFEIKSLSGVLLASDSTGLLPLTDDKKWVLYNFLLKTPVDVTDAIVSITINPPYGCGSAFAIDDISLRPCGPLITASIDGAPGPAEACADYTNPFILKADYSPGFSDPVLQWQSSSDSGRTWVDISGETTGVYAMPRRATDIILYRVCIAERTNINSIRCRIASNIIYTSIHPVPLPVAPKNVFGCAGKDYFFPVADPKALNVAWSGPGGYSSTQFNPVIPAIQYKDTGQYILKEIFYFNCKLSDTFNLKIFPSTTLTVQPSFPVCEGKSEQLFASGTGNVSYKWTPATGLSNDAIANPVATPADSIKYKVMVTNEYGCKDSATLKIDVYRNPVANAGPDKTILRGDTAVLNGVIKGTAVNYSWITDPYINDVHLVTPHVYPPVDKTYTLNVFSTLGCGTASDNVLVKVYSDFYIPNAFTPNGDGKNDKFQVLTLDNYKLNHLMIYNRWGQMVFKAEGSYKGWDGTYKGAPQPAGVYVYNLDMQTGSGQKIVKHGTIVLIR